MKLRKTIIFMLIAALAITLAACGGGGSSSGGGSADGGSSDQGGSSDSGSDEQIVLRVAWWGGQDRHDATLKVIEMYEEQNPHVKIEPEFSSYDGYWERMAAQAAGNNLPDVMNQNFGEYLTQYTERGLLADLTPFIEDGTIDTTYIDDSIIDSGKMGDKLVAISLGTNARAVLYDPELFERAGAKMPELGWTWDDVAEAGKLISQVTSWGINPLESRRTAEVWLREHGGRLFNDDGTGLGYDDDKIMEDYFAMHLDWLEQGIIAPLDVAKQHNSTENSLIVLGEVGMMFTWSNGVIGHSLAAQRPLELAPYPGPNHEKGLYLKPSMYFSIPESSDKKEEAAKFINFFINDIEANKILNADRGVPVNSQVLEAMKETVDEATRKTFEYIELITPHTSPIDKNHPATAAEVLSILQEVDEKVLYKQITPAEAAKEFRQRAEEVLNR